MKYFSIIFQAKRREKASLLLETLLSITVLSVVLTLMIQSITASLRATEYSRQYILGLNVLENALQDIVEAKFAKTNKQEEEKEIDGRVYHLSVDMQPLKTEIDLPILETVFKLTWTSGFKSNTLVTSTFTSSVPAQEKPPTGEEGIPADAGYIIEGEIQ